MKTTKKLFALLMLITINVNAQYCETFNKISHPGTWYITNFTLGDIDNTSANPSEFTHYSGVSTSLTQGTTYTGSINYTLQANQNHRLKIWIDYNGNGTLDDSGEEIFNPGQISGSPATEFSQDFTFTVPTTNITNGNTRLRVMLTRADYPACGSNSGTSGEVEDYDIEIRPTPTAPTAVCQNLNIELDIFGDAVITASQINNGSSDDYDAVGDLTLGIDQTEFDCDNLGANTVTLTVTDLDGLTDTCTATVNVSTYTGAFDVPAFETIEAYCGYTVATPILDYQCLTTITPTTSDITTFDTPGTYTITWSYFNGGTTETETQTVIITNPSIPTGLTVSNIDEEDADISWSSTDDPPFKVRYKESTESAWNVIKNISNTNTSLSGLKNNIQYDVQVATDADCATYTSTVNFTTLALSYCTPAAINNNSNFYINSIELNDIDTQYTSGSNGEYAFDSSVSTIIALGESLTGSITFNKAPHNNGYFNIWVDFNSDGDYDDTGEHVFNEENNQTSNVPSVIENISIPIPLTAATGKTRMRLSSSAKDPDSSCSFDNGAGAVLEIELDIRSNATAPTAVCQDLNIQLDISGNATITASQVDGGSTDDFDNSEDLILSIDKTDFDCDDLGDNDVTLTVTDSDGLSSTCTANVNVSTYSGSFTAPTLETVNAYCEYTASAPIFNYQCSTTITGTTSDTTTFNTNGTYTIDWSFDNGTTVVVSTQTIIVSTPTTPTSLSTSNITGTSVDISWSAVDTGPFVIRYKKTSESVWSEINSSTTNTSLSSLDTGTEYEIQVKVDAPDPSCANYTTSITFTTSSVTYCSSGINLNDSATDYISNVSIGDINQSSTNADSFYTYYSGVSTQLTAGGTLDAGTITYQRQASSISQFVIWIDFNKNGIFDNTTERIYENTTSGSATTEIIENLSSISIPSSALTGSTVMRIAMIINDSAITGPCDYSDSSGEVEDYDIVINEAVDVNSLYEATMITQVYHTDAGERWIEVTNQGSTTIPSNTINIGLYKDASGDQTGATPTGTYLIAEELSAGETTLIKSSGSSLIVSGIVDANVTDFDGENDILAIISETDTNAWANRYDVISGIANNTSYVRNDDISTYNNTYTSTEWTTFIDDNSTTKHPNAPVRTEVDNADATANAKLGVHHFGATDRTGSAWNNGFPDKSRQVSISEDYEHTGSSLGAKSLTLATSNKLTINNNSLIVTDGITLNTGSEIRLQGTSQLVQTHTNSEQITGDGKIYIDQNSTIANKYSFNYFSTPVNTNGTGTYTVANVLKDGTTPTTATSTATDINFISGYDGDATTPISIAEHWIYTYPSSLSSNSGYVQQLSTGTISNVTDGFIMKGPGVAQNYTFVGTPNDGNLSTSIGADETYLLGNPYPCAINAKEFIEDNTTSITGTLYFWQQISGSSDHNYGGYVGGYATRNTTMGVSADNVDSNNNTNNGTPTLGSGTYDEPEAYIAVGQGFFVLGDADGGTVTFNNSQRAYITEGAESIFFKKASNVINIAKTSKTSTSQNNISIIKLGIDYKNEEDLNLHRQLGISFSNGKTFAHENGYDSALFNESETSVYWKFPDNNEKYVIAGVQEISDDLEIPLEIVMGYDGALTFNIDEWQNVDRDVYLKDKTNDTTTKINGEEAIVNLTENTYSDRFYLTFKSNDSLTNETFENNQINLSYNKELQAILIDNLETTLLQRVELFNINGQQIKNWTEFKNNDLSIVLDLNITSPNIYILKLYTSNGIINKKIWID